MEPFYRTEHSSKKIIVTDTEKQKTRSYKINISYPQIMVYVEYNTCYPVGQKKVIKFEYRAKVFEFQRLSVLSRKNCSKIRKRVDTNDD